MKTQNEIQNLIEILSEVHEDIDAFIYDIEKWWISNAHIIGCKIGEYSLIGTRIYYNKILLSNDHICNFVDTFPQMLEDLLKKKITEYNDISNKLYSDILLTYITGRDIL